MEDSKYINKVIYLDNNDILPNRFQPRKYFDEEEIMQLSESIKEHGVINPIIVRKLGDKYELVAGERRYKANILAGNDNIPAIIMDVNDKESSEIAVVENIQRKDLNAIEEAISYKRILDIGYMTQEQLAQKMGKSQSAIANKIRLLKLSDEVQDALMKKEISERHARSLLKLNSHKMQNELLERIIKERLTVRKTDEEIEKMNNNMNMNFNNIMPNNSQNTINPVMPGSNVSDVNISGMETEPIINSEIDKSLINNNVSNVSTANIEPQVTQTPTIPVSTEPQAFQQNEAANVQTIPTLSIDDVLAKANQPSVVGNQPLEFSKSATQNNENNQQNSTVLPNLNPINEEPTPIGESNNNTSSSMPEISPITNSQDILNNNTPINSNISQEPQTNGFDMENNQNGITDNFEIPNLDPISEKPAEVDSFLNSVNNPTLSSNNINNNIGESVNQNINTFGDFNANNNSVASPINTSPIIDTTSHEKTEIPTNNLNVNNVGLESNAQTQSQTQFEKIPEPIIVNDYNNQYDPIMPQQQNSQPTIDFKTIINLIRKCSQAIENSGYKIETEEYNLDNLYQVVFKINKQ